MIRVLITGGAGYVGSVLTDVLVEHFGRERFGPTYDVTVLDNFSTGENSLAAVCRHFNFHAVKGDCRDARVLEPLVRGADVIIPLAAKVGAPLCALDESAAISVNQMAIATLCGMASPSQMILYPNTNSGYGTTGTDECTEDTPVKPISVYGVTKAAAEGIVMDRENSLAFRFATAFGASPRMRLDLLVNDFTYRAWLDKCVVIFEGHFRRNFVHVRDMAGAFRHAIENFAVMRGQVYNCGLSNANLTKIELFPKFQIDFSYRIVLF